MPSLWLVAILSCIRNAFFGLVYSLCQKIIGCIPYTESWSSQISNKLFLNLETSTRWHSLFFPKSQLVVPYTAFLVRDNACIVHFCHESSIWSNICHKISLISNKISKTQIKIAKTQIKFCQNSVQFVQNSDFTTHWGRAVSRGGVQK